MRLSILLLFSIIAVISLHNHHNHHHLSSVEAKPVDQPTTTQPPTTPTPAPLSPAPTNHRIKFLGLKHDYASDEEAKQALANNLKAITGFDDIIVESMDEQGATWHLGGKLASTDQNCPEQEIRQIVSKIKEPNEAEFTREFKMWIDERFLKPSQVQILWQGPCGNLARKRSRVETGPGSNMIIEMADSSIEELMPTTTTEFAVTSVSNEPPVESNSTLTSNTTTATITTPEPRQPTTTTELPTQPAVETATSTATTAEEILSPSLSPMEPFDFAPMEDMNSTFTATTSKATTLNTTVTTTTTTPSTVTTVISAASPETIATESKVPPSPPPTTPAPTTTAPTTSTSTTILEPSTTTLRPSLSSQEEAIGLDGEGDSTGPHYGKYIGFCAAFLIFVAYLVCSRAYKRHGMYELHSE